MVFGKINTIPSQQAGGVGRHEINLASNRPGPSGLQPADPKIGVKADDDSLEELLIGLPGRGHELLPVAGKTTDQAVRGNEGTERPGVDVVPAHVFRTPHLPGNIPRLAGPRLCRHPGLPIATQKKTTNLARGPSSTMFRLLETRLRGLDSRTHIQERLSRIKSQRNHTVSPEGLGASRLPSFGRNIAREDRCFFLRCYRKPALVLARSVLTLPDDQREEQSNKGVRDAHPTELWQAIDSSGCGT